MKWTFVISLSLLEHAAIKAVFVPRYGPPEVVEFREAPTPSPGAGEVRIRILAAAVTAGDWRLRSGIMPRGFGALRGIALGFGGPRKGILGTDAAGVIDAVGAGVAGFQVGESVLAFPGISMGGHAEFLVMPADGCVARNAPYSRVRRILAPRGRLLAVLADLPAVLGSAFAGCTKSHRVIAGPASEKPEDLITLAELAAQGKLRPVIDQRFPFERIVDAYRVVDSGRKKGSVVLWLDPCATLTT